MIFTHIPRKELGCLYHMREIRPPIDGIRSPLGAHPVDQFILKEDGSFLLLETGDKMILEE